MGLFTFIAHESPDRGRRSSTLHFVYPGGRWVFDATPRPLYLRERDPVPTVKETVWALAPVWTDAKLVPSWSCLKAVYKPV